MPVRRCLAAAWASAAGILLLTFTPQPSPRSSRTRPLRGRFPPSNHPHGTEIGPYTRNAGVVFGRCTSQRPKTTSDASYTVAPDLERECVGRVSVLHAKIEVTEPPSQVVCLLLVIHVAHTTVEEP